jgi:hypothetical protein
MKQLLEKSLLQKIERLEAFEDRMKIRLENISVSIKDDDWVKFFLEIHPQKGNKLEENMIIECILYDSNGGILDRDNNWLDSEDFFGFEVMEFSFQLDNILDRISKVRIYPKK